MSKNTSSLDRLFGKHPDTAKLRVFVFFMYCIDAMVMNFLMVFFNQCKLDLGWSPTMSSIALCVLPFSAAIGTIVLSFFSSTAKRNLNVLRICMSILFLCTVLLSVIGLTVDSGYHGGRITDPVAYYGVYAAYVFFAFMIYGLEWGMQPVYQSVIADINNREGTKFGNVYCVASVVYIVASPLGGLVAQSLGTGYVGYLWMFLAVSPAAVLTVLSTFLFHTRKELGAAVEIEEKSSALDAVAVFKNRSFLYYLGFTICLTGVFFTFDSVASDLWTGLAYQQTETLFTPFNWGLVTGVGCVFEFLMMNVCTKFLKNGNEKQWLVASALVLVVRAIAVGIFSVFFFKPVAPNWFAYLFIGLGSLRGVTWGIFCAVNVPTMEFILGPKLRQKGVFMVPITYQILNGILQFIYPQITGIQDGRFRYVVFFAVAAFAALAACGYGFMKNKNSVSDKKA